MHPHSFAAGVTGAPREQVDDGSWTTFDQHADVVVHCRQKGDEKLFARTARLPRVDFREPEKLIGTNTVASVQSGLYYGALGMIDGMVERLMKELGPQTRIVATGGQARLISRGSRYLKVIDENLTLEGLEIIWNRVVRP